jgi:hypothetical protein
MSTEQHYRRMLEKNPNATIGFNLAASMVYAARYGPWDVVHIRTDEMKTIIGDLKARYEKDLSPGDVAAEMDKAKR